MAVPDITVSVTRSLVRIRAADGPPRGAGCHIGRRRVLTASHVVARLLRLPDHDPTVPQGTVMVDFPYVDQIPRPARVIAWGPADTSSDRPLIRDVAVLELDDLPDGAGVAPLRAVTGRWNRSLSVWGYPRGFEQGQRLSCTANGLRADGVVQLDGHDRLTYWFQPGFSGGIGWDGQLGWALGVVVARPRQREVRIGYMVPLVEVRRQWQQIWDEARASEQEAEDPCTRRFNEMARAVEKLPASLLADLLRDLPLRDHEQDEDYAAEAFVQRLITAGLEDIGTAVRALRFEATVTQMVSLYDWAAPFAIVDALAAGDIRDRLLAVANEDADRAEARITPRVEQPATGQVVLDRSSAGMGELYVCQVGGPRGEPLEDYEAKLRRALCWEHAPRCFEDPQSCEMSGCVLEAATLSRHLRKHRTAVIVPPSVPDDGVLEKLRTAFPEVFFLLLSEEADCRRLSVGPAPAPVLIRDETELMDEYEHAHRQFRTLELAR